MRIQKTKIKATITNKNNFDLFFTLLNPTKNNENGKSKYVYSSIDKLQDSGKKAGDFDAEFCKKRK